MTKMTQETRASVWKRLFVEPSSAIEFIANPHPAFLACSVVALLAGIVGWTMASMITGWLIPICSVVAILTGLLGVRSKLRSLGLIGFVMGMFLLPNAVNTVICLLGT
ncbi:hypothetical protein KAT84_04605 [Candidatus Bipolaricaulota bacterium]|nr:hypothetical protein [Candidatus Bipolaricaulota bacterium]